MTTSSSPLATVAAEGDAALAALGVQRLPIPIPFREAGNSVNLYLIDNPDGSLTLFDAGLGTVEAKAALTEGFARLGRRFDEVRRIILSHGHIDHYGAARLVRDRSAAEVLVHPRDASKVLRDEVTQREPLWPYVVKLGVPAELVDAARAIYGQRPAYADTLDAAGPLAAGQRFEFRHFSGTIVEMPGHTPGLVCLHDAEHRLLFTGDHLLARISPNPLIDIGDGGEEHKFRALAAYLESIERVKSLELDWVVPGHGTPFTGHRAVIRGLQAFYLRRQVKILDALGHGPLTPFELVFKVFNRARPHEVFLMLSEIVGNLEVLEDRGLVERFPGELPYRYRSTTPKI